MTDRLRYRIVDVFTTEPFAGNPLAVVLDADELDTAAMQVLAREFNLSETTFPAGPEQPGADYRVRIFTPASELPFAGHPSLGTAWVLCDEGRIAAGRAVQSCGAGLVPLDVSADGRVVLGGGPPTVGEPMAAGPLLAALGLEDGDLAGPAPRLAGAGLEFAFLAVRPGAVARARPDRAALERLELPAGVAVFARDGASVHARVFPGSVGITEDPATGSAALGLGVYLVASGLAPGDGETACVVAQGAEVGRPSRLECTVRASGGRAVDTTVAGSVVPVASGEIRRPPG